MSRGGAEREEDTESEARSGLWAVSTEPDTGLELMNRKNMTWAKVGRLTDWATQVPPYLFIYVFIYLFNFFFNFYLFLRQRQSMSGEGAERGDTESKPGSGLWAVSTEPDTGLELTNHEIITWAKVRCLTDWATPRLKVPQD